LRGSYLTGNLARLFSVGHDFEVKDRKVEHQPEVDRAGWGQLLLAQLERVFVSLVSDSGAFYNSKITSMFRYQNVKITLAALSGQDLRQVAVVISLHLQEEDFGFITGGFRNEVLVQHDLQ